MDNTFIDKLLSAEKENKKLKGENDELHNLMMINRRHSDENAELKKKVAYLEKDNEVGQEAFSKMIKMEEENKQFKVLNRIIGNNWDYFKEDFEKWEKELIECGFATSGDFE